MQIKFLKSIVEDVINKQSTPIIDLLANKKDVNEFTIAKKLGLTINQTRNILYKLSDYGLVSFIRKKDKRKGWYIYFWTLNVYQSLKLLEQNLKKELERLESQLKNRRERRYFICNTCSIENSEETALLNDFICPECEGVYELSDNQEIIKKLEKDITKIKKEIKLVFFEREKEREKLEKKKTRKIKREELEKKKLRKKSKKKKEKKVKKKTKKKSKKSEKVIKKKSKKVKKKVVKKKTKKKKKSKKK